MARQRGREDGVAASRGPARARRHSALGVTLERDRATTHLERVPAQPAVSLGSWTRAFWGDAGAAAGAGVGPLGLLAEPPDEGDCAAKATPPVFPPPPVVGRTTGALPRGGDPGAARLPWKVTGVDGTTGRGGTGTRDQPGQAPGKTKGRRLGRREGDPGRWKEEAGRD